MDAKIIKWGNSQGIRIPKMILDALKWSDNEDIVILTEGDKLIIKKAHPHTRKNIKELFADYKDNYTPIDVDWGKPEGKEIW